MTVLDKSCMDQRNKTQTTQRNQRTLDHWRGARGRVDASARSRKERQTSDRRRKKARECRIKDIRSKPCGWYGGEEEVWIHLWIFSMGLPRKASWQVLVDMAGWGPCSSSDQHKGSVNWKKLWMHSGFYFYLSQFKSMFPGLWGDLTSRELQRQVRAQKQQTYF